MGAMPSGRIAQEHRGQGPFLREQGICNSFPTNENATPGVAFCA